MDVENRNCDALVANRIVCIVARLVSTDVYPLNFSFDKQSKGLECVYETKRVKPGLKGGAVENIHRRLGSYLRRFPPRFQTMTEICR